MPRNLPLSAALLFFLSPAFAAEKIITFSAGTGAEAQARLIASRGGRIVKEFSFINAVLADFPENTKAADITRSPGVDGAEDDREIYWLSSDEAPFAAAAAISAGAVRDGGTLPGEPPAVSSPSAPQPPDYLSIASANGNPDRMPWSLQRLEVPPAWARTMGAGARVAVLDTGVDCAHPDLAPNCLPGYNVINPGALPADDKGHGTHVAGIIAGALNGRGMVGVAPKASIFPVKVLNSSGTGKISEIIAGIEWAVQNRADVINMSLGAPGYSEAQAKAVKAASAAGILVVCAAGNDAGPVDYPGAYPDAVAVTALDYADKLADFSCKGPEVAFAVPGVKIYSSYPDGKFTILAGTSQAAPHVSGLAALAVSLGLHGPDAIRAALVKASAGLGLPPQEQGAGLPSAARLVNNIISGRQ